MISVVVLTYNRLGSLKSCLAAIGSYSTEPHEVIVVNNASTDGTTEFLDSLVGETFPNFHAIHMPDNIGVIARNFGFRKATGDFIAQVDDDVEVLPGWDRRALSIFSADNSIGMVGQQGGLIKVWLDVLSHVHHNNNGYVDYLTGFFLMMRNVGILYDEAFGKFWHEELDLSLQYKYAGYRLFTQGGFCNHYSQRNEPIDWDLLNRNHNYATQKWADKIEQLNLEGLK